MAEDPPSTDDATQAPAPTSVRADAPAPFRRGRGDDGRRLKPGYEGRFAPGRKTVDDPYDGSKLKAAINKSHDPLENLFVRGSIDEAQKRAGDRVRALRLQGEGSGHGGRDLSEDRVDGGSIWKDIPANRLDALKALTALSRHLGRVHYALVMRVAADGLNIGDVARLWWGTAKPSKMQKDYVSKALQDALSEAAAHFGYQTAGASPSDRLGGA